MFSELLEGLRQFTVRILDEQTTRDIDLLHSNITSHTSSKFFTDLLVDSFLENDKMVLVFESGKVRTYARGSKAIVTHIIDGDTIVIKFSDNTSVKVRLLGLDCPEIEKPGQSYQQAGSNKSYCFGQQALLKTRRTLTEKEIYINFDLNTLDQFKRLLLMVYFNREEALQQDSTITPSFNYQLVRDGFAKACIYDDNPTFMSQFNYAHRLARETNKGAWGHCEFPFEK
jgi:micrococcal nuclease